MRSTRRRVGRAVIGCLALLVSTSIAVVGAQAPAHASPGCAQELTIFARGSGAGFSASEATKFRNGVRDGLNAQGISNNWLELGDEDGNGQLDTGGYQATGGPGPVQTAYKWLINPTYSASRNSGVNELTSFINARAVSCPSEVYVLGGYSQGADVIGTVLGTSGTISSTARGRIAYAALYGDPTFAAGSLSARQHNAPPWWNQGDNPGYQWRTIQPPVWGASPTTYLAPEDGALGARQPQADFQGRLGSWCDALDGVCTGSIADGLGMGSHGAAYQNTWIASSMSQILPVAAAKVANPSAPAPGAPLSTATVNYLADRTILHGSDGSLWVMAGGAKFYFGSMTEFYNLGYSTSNMVNIDMTTLGGIPNVPRDGTVLRSGGGQIYTIAGGAKFVFGSMTEYYNQGYVNNQWINVPQWPLDQIGDAPGNMPRDGTILRHPNGNVYIVVGGVKFQFGSMSELTSLGYSTSQLMYVSGAPADAIPSASNTAPPANGIMLRSGGGQIYVVDGGAKFHFGTMAEIGGDYVAGSWWNVPQSPLDAIGDVPGNMPRNGTVALRPDGALFVIAGGVRWQFGTMSEFSSEGYNTYTLVAQAPLDGIYDASSSNLPANETVFQGTGATLWVMKAGVRRSFTSMTQFTNMGYTTSQIVRVPDAVLNGLPSGGNLP